MRLKSSCRIRILQPTRGRVVQAEDPSVGIDGATITVYDSETSSDGSEGGGFFDVSSETGHWAIEVTAPGRSLYRFEQTLHATANHPPLVDGQPKVYLSVVPAVEPVCGTSPISGQ